MTIKMYLQIVLVISVVFPAAIVTKSQVFGDSYSFIIGKSVKQISDNDCKDIDIKAEMIKLTERLDEQGQIIKDMQKIIKIQASKLDKKDHVIKLIIDKLAESDKTIEEIKSEVN